jgi:hypothetical protein
VAAVEGTELLHLYVELVNARAPYGVLYDAIKMHPKRTREPLPVALIRGIACSQARQT